MSTPPPPRADPLTYSSLHQYTLALSAVEGAGWSGTWVFRVTLDAETEEVWFETKLSQRKGAFGTTIGGDQASEIFAGSFLLWLQFAAVVKMVQLLFVVSLCLYSFSPSCWTHVRRRLSLYPIACPDPDVFFSSMVGLNLTPTI